MCSAALLLSLLAAIDPVRIGITALLITRPRPMLNLLTFWLGGVVGGVAAAFAVLLLLRNFTLAAMRSVISATNSPIMAYLQVAAGILAVACAALLIARVAARPRARVTPSTGESFISLRQQTTRSPSRRLSIRARLEGGSLVAAFVGGVALATPPVEYMAAILAIVASEPAAPAQIAAALVFTVVAFTIVEIPLVTYLTAPKRTLAVVRRINEWISARRHAIPAVVIAVVGISLVASGVGRV